MSERVERLLTALDRRIEETHGTQRELYYRGIQSGACMALAAIHIDERKASRGSGSPQEEQQ